MKTDKSSEKKLKFNLMHFIKKNRNNSQIKGTVDVVQIFNLTIFNYWFSVNVAFKIMQRQWRNGDCWEAKTFLDRNTTCQFIDRGSF